jgi:uncharacterized integral membrane protein
MNDRDDFSRQLLNQNGLSEEATEEIRRQQARSLVLAEKRRVGRIRMICIGSWALTVVVIFASMGLATLFLFVARTGDRPMALLILAARIVGFMVAVVSSVAWYFRARTAGLTAIDARLSELETILRAEAERASQENE